MTTNQTIGGGTRELLERVATEANHMLGFTYAANYDECRAAVDELRAVLDATEPAWNPHPDVANLAALLIELAQHGIKVSGGKSDEPWSVEPAAQSQGVPVPFQVRVKPWMLECFGEVIAADRQERNHRFLEEALELVQSNQCTAREAHQLVDYVYGRPVGDPAQEVGGVMVTLAALCLAAGLDMHAAGETELARIWTKVEQIRAKQAAKPAMSPLPGAYPDREQPAPVAVVIPEKYDDVLLPFLSLMRAELHANAHKGDRPGWLQMDRKTAILEVFYHMGKLHQAVHRSDSAAIKEYAADVANMCMMLLDVCDCLDEATRLNTK